MAGLHYWIGSSTRLVCSPANYFSGACAVVVARAGTDIRVLPPGRRGAGDPWRSGVGRVTCPSVTMRTESER